MAFHTKSFTEAEGGNPLSSSLHPKKFSAQKKETKKRLILFFIFRNFKLNFKSMKNLVFIFIFSNLILACRNSAIPVKPEILTAEYALVTNGEFERGYQLMLEFKMDQDIAIRSIILKNKKFTFKIGRASCREK